MIAALLANMLFCLVTLNADLPSLWVIVLRVTLILQVLFYGLAIAGKFLSGTLSNRSKLIRLLMLPYFLCATNFAGFTGLADFVSGRRSVLWQQASRR
jgi:hypothetical protein